MSFQNMRKQELLKVAVEDFAVDVNEAHTKPQIIAALVENGVTYDMARQHSDTVKAFDEAATGVDPLAAAQLAVEENRGNVVTTDTITTHQAGTIVEEPVVVVAEAPVVITAPKPVMPEKVLLRMDRANPSYQIRGYTFTRQHPYALVKAADAEYIVENIEGFYYATPKEAQDFYG